MTDVVVITGAASGIGAAVTQRFRESGWTTIGVDRHAVVDDSSYVCDLTDPDSIDALVAALPAEITALCNVAGLPGTAPAASVLAVNLLGHRHLTEAVLPRVRDGGAIVNVASRAGGGWMSLLGPIGELLATPDMASGLAWYAEHAPEGSAYDFSKAAMIVYSMQLSQRAFDRGVRVNSVSPGPTDTPILGDFRASMGPTIDLAAAHLGRHGTPAEVAEAVYFLTTPAASWINGHDLWVDGGLGAALITGALSFPAA